MAVICYAQTDTVRRLKIKRVLRSARTEAPKAVTRTVAKTARFTQGRMRTLLTCLSPTTPALSDRLKRFLSPAHFLTF